MHQYPLQVVLFLLFLTAIHAGPSTNIQHKVEDALNAAESGDYTKVDALRGEYNVALPHFLQHVDSPSPNVRSAVLTFIRDSKTAQCVTTLSVLTADREKWVAEQAVRVLYERYTCSEAVSLGGMDLKDHLCGNIRTHHNSAKAILLLTCFTNDASVIDFLVSEREGPATMTKLENWLPIVDTRLCIDLALVELGEPRALPRLLARLKTGQVSELVFVLKADRFVNDPRLLAAIVELLRDKRDALAGGPSHTGAPPVRVCDLALSLLGSKSKVNLGFETKSELLFIDRRFTDEQISTGYRRLRESSDP
jgi:HEAT repeat protein